MGGLRGVHATRARGLGVSCNAYKIIIIIIVIRTFVMGGGGNVDTLETDSVLLLCPFCQGFFFINTL